MNLVDIREEILSKNLTPMEKASMFLQYKAACKLSHAQWLFFTYPLPREVKAAVAFLELPQSTFRGLPSPFTCITSSSCLQRFEMICAREQPRQIAVLKADMEQYFEEKVAERISGTTSCAPDGKQALSLLLSDMYYVSSRPFEDKLRRGCYFNILHRPLAFTEVKANKKHTSGLSTHGILMAVYLRCD